MAKAKRITNPPASLGTRLGDVPWAVLHSVVNKLSIFAQLANQDNIPDLNEYPDALRIRRLNQNDTICRQGDAGWTAFYTLTREDAQIILEAHVAIENDVKVKQQLEKELEELREEIQSTPNAPKNHDTRKVAKVYVQFADRPDEQPGFLSRILSSVFGRNRRTTKAPPLSIPIDGPVDIPYDTRQVDLYQGDLVGEQSCLYGTPRSASIIATRPCYVLEFLRNVFDALRKDTAFLEEMDRNYIDRIMKTHLQGTELLRELSEPGFEIIQKHVELVRKKDGDIICDEFDESDSFYIVRSGLVRVLKGVSALLSPEDILDGDSLLGMLREGLESAKGGLTILALQLPEALRSRILAGVSFDELKSDLITGFNQLIKSLTHDKSQAILEGKESNLAERTRIPPARPVDWSEQTRRRYNRYALETVLPKRLRELREQSGPETTITYLSRGEIIGEMGVLHKLPRSATCVAYVRPPSLTTKSTSTIVHYQKTDLVELVKLPGWILRKLDTTDPHITRKITEIADQRDRTEKKKLEELRTDSSRERVDSARFTELGLVQGQKLMMIDLNRCTRCDECVQACVDTHDGRTRLFLDGPRIGSYLVPSTCRACRDPLCLIDCPVGSIHRGNNLDIIIEDWCIGCTQCANNCPYGSIQMHDIGIVPSSAQEWFVREGEDDSLIWTEAEYEPRGWFVTATPIKDGKEFRDMLGIRTGIPPKKMRLWFRHRFDVSAKLARDAKEFKLTVKTCDPEAAIYLNGIKQKKPERGTVVVKNDVIRNGANVIAVALDWTPTTASLTATLLDSRLDDERTHSTATIGESGQSLQWQEHRERLVWREAVVCDMCSSVPGQRPACVTACPHDAAIRIDALTEYPPR